MKDFFLKSLDAFLWLRPPDDQTFSSVGREYSDRDEGAYNTGVDTSTAAGASTSTGTRKLRRHRT